MTRNLETIRMDEVIKNLETGLMDSAKEQITQERLLWFILGAVATYALMSVLFVALIWAIDK